MYWMITNRNTKSDGFGDEFSKMTFWKNESDKVDDFAAWKSMSTDEFRQSVVQVADTFPDPISTPSEDQKHVTIFVHGFDNSWSSAVQRYGRIVENLFSGPESLGLCVYLPGLQKAPPLAIIPIARKRENRLRTSPTC